MGELGSNFKVQAEKEKEVDQTRNYTFG